MAAVQTPQFVIFRTTFLGKGSLLAEKGIALGMSQDSAHILSLNISSSIETEPGTLNLSFAIPTDSPVNKGTYNTLDGYLFDFKSGQVTWQIMDEIQLYVSPSLVRITETEKDGVTVSKWREKYVRLFMGIITSITGSWDGASLTINLTARDLLYWLDLAKIQQKPSIHELLLRGDLDKASNKEVSVLLSYKSKYQGIYLKELINQILADPGQNEVQGIFLSELTIPDMLTHIGSGNFVNALKRDTLISLEYAQQAAKNAEDTTRSQVPEPLSAKAAALQGRNAFLDKDQISSRVIEELSEVRSIADTASDFLQQKQVRQVLCAYWDARFGRLIRDNYFSFVTTTDQMLVPFPIEFQAPSLINGEYRSKLSFLKQLSELTIYEIYQSPQGYIIVKPPLYNSIPLTSITTDEIASVTRNIDANKILTQVTVQGTLVAGSGATRDTGVLLNMDNAFPFIQGTYTYLFPKGFRKEILGAIQSADIPVPFVDVPRNYSVLKHFVDDWNSTRKKDASAKYIVSLYPVDAGEPITAHTTIEDNSLAREQIFTTAVANILIANTHKFDVQEQFTQYTSAPGALNISSFFQTYAEDMTRLIAAILVNRMGLVPTSSERAYIKGAALYYLKKWEQMSPENRKSFSVVPQMTSTVIKELIRGGVIYTRTSASISTPTPASAPTDSSFVAPPNEDINRTVSSSPTGITLTEKPADASASTEANALARAGSLTIPSFLFRIIFRVNSQIPSDKISELSTGEYNVLQHGLRSTRADNALVRDNKSAVLFAKFWLDRNNASVETTEVVLKTLRADIVPGFPIYNEMDACIYYVQGVEYRVTAGSNIETSLSLIARRRPVWKAASKEPTKVECDEILDKLQSHEDAPDDVYIGTEVTHKGQRLVDIQPDETNKDQPPKKIYLVGWEYIGGNVQVPAGHGTKAFSPGTYVPSYGAIITRYTSSTDGSKKSEQGRSYITSSEKLVYHIGFPNFPQSQTTTSSTILPNTDIINTPSLSPTIDSASARITTARADITLPLNWIIPLSYVTSQKEIDTLIASKAPIKYSDPAKETDIKDIVTKWALMQGGNMWHPKQLPDFNTMSLVSLVQAGRLILIKSASFTLGTSDFTSVDSDTAVNYYANQYVIADFVYVAPDDFRTYLTSLTVKSGPNSFDTNTINALVSAYEQNLERFKSEKFNAIVRTT